MNGSHVDSSAYDVQLMRKRSYILHKKLESIVQRRAYDVLRPYLPEKLEYVVKIKLTPVQMALIKGYLNEVTLEGGFGGKDTGRPTRLLKDFQQFTKIWTHPAALELHRQKNKKKADKELDSDDSLNDFIVDGSDEEDESSGSETRKSKAAKFVFVTYFFQ
jgi:transcriptional regulator ATRX